ncbi:type IV pilus modification PilV family protein [Poseidonibacter sp.]|uniref:type IV pilus modification PilV family protein n=1 Tax=Poseidonibacter sp. TaxID=2321188 RepID=UPI003C76020D
MKKAFSLMEVLIAVTILSIVMISLLQIKSDNIFLVSKVDEKVKFNDYILLSLDLDKAENRNQNIFLDRKYDFSNDEIRRELKTIKVKQKDKKIKTQKIKDVDDFNLNIITYSTSYSLDDKIKKNIYTFKLEL